MLITVIIESRLSGSAAGSVELNPDSSETINGLITTFCIEKGIRQMRQYVLRNGNDDVLDLNKTLIECGITDGETLYFTKPKEDLFGFQNWYLMAGVALFITVVGLIAVNIIHSYNGNIPDSYGIVFDAGSTHTAMLVYEWGGAKLNNTGTPKQVHQCNMKGISLYPSIDELKTDLKKCTDDGKSVIPGGKVGKTPIMLGATAGMRLLNIKNGTLANSIMQAVDQVFSTSGFYYTSGMATIISGITEGADSWTTTNYAENILTSPTMSSHYLGTLDLGGASTQFATELQIDTKLESNATVSYLTLYGGTHNISVNSYLCFGQVQASLRYQAQLTEGWKLQPIIDPCLPRGYNLSMTLGAIFDSPCTNMSDALRPNYNKSTIVTFVGSSNYSQCLPLVAQLFNRSACRDHYIFDYCFEHEDLGNLHQQFLAISGFYEMVHIFNLSQPTLPEFMNAVATICESSWEQVVYFQKRLTNSISSYAERYCFEGAYIGQLLTTGYNFNETTWTTSLTFQNTVNDIDLGWTMGLMINATNEVPSESPIVIIIMPTFIFLNILFVMFFLVSLAFGIHAWKRNRRQPTYQRLSMSIENGSISDGELEHND